MISSTSQRMHTPVRLHRARVDELIRVGFEVELQGAAQQPVSAALEANDAGGEATSPFDMIQLRDPLHNSHLAQAPMELYYRKIRLCTASWENYSLNITGGYRKRYVDRWGRWTGSGQIIEECKGECTTERGTATPDWLLMLAPAKRAHS